MLKRIKEKFKDADNVIDFSVDAFLLLFDIFTTPLLIPLRIAKYYLKAFIRGFIKKFLKKTYRAIYGKQNKGDK